MKISLKQIKPSPLAVRKTWDEEALEQLAQSIKEHGLIVPIKVRPDGNGKYEIVYGHRRVKAMRRAGIKETEAIVEGVDDTGVLVQALIENVQREDMNPVDIARTLFAIQEETGWSQKEMARMGILPEKTISNYMSLLRESPKIHKLIERGAPLGRGGGTHAPEGKVTSSHIIEVRQTGLSQPEREAVIEKAAKEGLTAQQARRVAETVKAAPSEQAKKKVLEWEYSPTLHDPERIQARAKKYGAHDVMYREKRPRADADWREAPEVAAFLEVASAFRETIGAFRKTVDIGKLAPEGRPFVAQRLRAIREDIDRLIAELEQ